MKIDWFTVGAQVINFLILIWLLKRFLYKPVLNAVQEREKKIAGQISDAQKLDQEARQQREEYEDKNEQWNRERAELQEKAGQEISQERSRQLEAARQEATELRQRLQEQARLEEEQWERNLVGRTQEVVMNTTRKVLKDLADRDLQQSMLSVFVRRLGDLPSPEKQKLHEALKESPRILIRSSFGLEDPQKKSLENAFAEYHPSSISYENDRSELCGIEMQAGGFRLSWTIAEYLDEMKGRLSALQNKEQVQEAPLKKD